MIVSTPWQVSRFYVPKLASRVVLLKDDNPEDGRWAVLSARLVKNRLGSFVDRGFVPEAEHPSFFFGYHPAGIFFDHRPLRLRRALLNTPG